MKHIIITGNPIDGLNFIGPFETAAEAAERGNTDPNIEADWWIAPIEEPTND